MCQKVRREYAPGEQEALMIGILRGTPDDVQWHERYDAASDLEEFPSDAVVAALAEFACDPTQPDETFVALCAESIAGIWVHRGAVDHDLLSRLTPWARREAEATVAHRAPELLTR
ncbi:hypothetical protein [Streptomyces rubellomurinus]|uniref:Uncharacterized protein n=2 Tax=Streptomyces TaxID=1883 RepID=A0A0F2TMH0_STRR3|nr:hypothetical protein [Streptomyces rubellomurinus]KJS56478.1 hypothetical protein VM98_06600 [Streptomyces rubellomurinus subsp. indigoferus]KJS63711.1 hypothetical protein VM95_00015 [Streptomyces rubellomurinus]